MKLRSITKLIWAILAVSVVATSSCMSVFAYDEDTLSSESYTYNYDAESVSIPNAYEYYDTYALTDGEGNSAVEPQDMFVAKNGDVYIVDTKNSRILVYTSDFVFKTCLNGVTDSNGEYTDFAQPQGIYVYEDGNILVADTDNNRVVRCDINGNCNLIIEKSSELTGVGELTDFIPLKLSVDNVGRIYVVARDINFGFLQYEGNGEFITYMGAPRVQLDFFNAFWRRFSTKKQLAQMTQFVSTEYNNICIDDEGFIYGTISALGTDDIKSAIQSRDDSGSVSPIKKINANGDDILLRKGYYAPLGDLDFEDEPSRIIDVALGSSGTYSLLDQTLSHIFTYDNQGNLLFAFGNNGNKKYSIQQPTAIGYIGDDIVVLDSNTNSVLRFKMTDYGNMVIQAVNANYVGNYSEAEQLWSEVAEQNTNFKYAFEGLGSAEYSAQNYEKAMEYYKFAESNKNYSDAFEAQRKIVIQKYFPTILISVIVIIVGLAIFSIAKKIYRYGRGYYD